MKETGIIFSGEMVTAIMAHRLGTWFFSDSTGDVKAYMLRGDAVIAWMSLPEPYKQ